MGDCCAFRLGVSLARSVFDCLRRKLNRGLQQKLNGHKNHSRGLVFLAGASIGRQPPLLTQRECHSHSVTLKAWVAHFQGPSSVCSFTSSPSFPWNPSLLILLSYGVLGTPGDDQGWMVACDGQKEDDRAAAFCQNLLSSAVTLGTTRPSWNFPPTIANRLFFASSGPGCTYKFVVTRPSLLHLNSHLSARGR